MRNRLVAALGDATVVVEASYKSGGLITARLAADLGRPVFAIPGDIRRPNSEGTNALIKDGAMLTTSASDVCAVLGWATAMDDMASSAGHPILKLLHARLEPCDPETVALACGMEIGAAVAELTVLELAGQVRRHDGGLYAAVASARR